MNSIDELKEAIVNIKPNKACEITSGLLEQGVDAQIILNQALIPGMDEVGRLFKEGEYFVPEVLVCRQSHARIIECYRASVGKSQRATERQNCYPAQWKVICTI